MVFFTQKDAVTELWPMLTSLPLRPQTKKKLEEAYQDAFAGDRIDFQATALKEIPENFVATYGEGDSIKETASRYSFYDVIRRWAEEQLYPVLR